MFTMKKILAGLLAAVMVCVSYAVELTGDIDLGAENAVLSYADGITGNATITNSSTAMVTLTITVPENVEASFEGTIHGNIRVVKLGAGLQRLVAGSTYTNGTDILGGTIAISDQTALGVGDNNNEQGRVIVNGGTLRVEANMDIISTYYIQFENQGVLEIPEGVRVGFHSGKVLRTAGATFTKRGKGTLHFVLDRTMAFTQNTTSATWIIEDGVFDWGGAQNPFGLNVELAPTIHLGEGVVMKTKRHCTLPNLVLNGAQVVCDYWVVDEAGISANNTNISVDHTNTPINVVNMSTNKSWIIGGVTVQKNESSIPSVLHAPWAKVLPSCGTVFDVEEGAELQLDVELYPAVVNGVEERSGFVKKGGGRLTFQKACNLNKTVFLEDCEVVLTKNAWFDHGGKVDVIGKAKIILEDGAYVNLGSAAAQNYSLIASADVWVDATRLNGVDGESIGFVQNLGTAGGLFSVPDKPAPENLATYTGAGIIPDAPKYANNGIDGKPALYFDGTDGLVLNSYTNRTSNLTVFIVNQWTSWKKYGSPFSFSTADSEKFDNDTAGSFFYQRNGSDLAQLQVRCYSNGITVNTGLQVDESTITSVVTTNRKTTVWSYRNKSTDPVAQSGSLGSFDIDVVSIGGRLAGFGTMQRYYNTDQNRMFNGYIGELLVFSRQLSAAEIESVKAYLHNKWFASETSWEMSIADQELEEKAFSVETRGNAKAALDVGAWSSGGASLLIDKMGAGTLQFANISDSAVALKVEEGRLLLGDARVGVQADLWMDAADETTVTLDAAGERAIEVRNKGRLGGVFAQNHRVTTVPCPTYLKGGLKARNCLDFKHDSALVTEAYTNKVGRNLSFYVVLYKEDMVMNGGQGGQWTGPFAMGTVDATDIDNKTPGSFALFHEKNERKNKYTWNYLAQEGLPEYMFTFNRAWTNEPYIMIGHLHTDGSVYTEILESDDTLELPVCAAYGQTPPPLNIDVTVLGGRLGKGGCPQYNTQAGLDGNRMWKGKMGEFIVFSQKPTREQETNLIGYLRKKWFNKGDGSETPPQCLAGSSSARLKTTAKTALVMAGGTTLAHAVGAQDLASLTAEGGVTWEKANTAENGCTFFNVAGSVGFAAGQRVQFDILPKDSVTLFTYGAACAFGDWSVVGEDADRAKVVHRASQKTIELSRNLGTLIVIR